MAFWGFDSMQVLWLKSPVIQGHRNWLMNSSLIMSEEYLALIGQLCLGEGVLLFKWDSLGFLVGLPSP